MDRGEKAVTTLAVIRAIDLLERHVCASERDYGAYREDPIEANLHELGHVLTARGGLERALRDADAGYTFDVDMFCGQMRRADRNEYNAIAFTLLVCRSVGHRVDEQEIVRLANVTSASDSPIGREIRRFNVAKSLRDPRIQRIAQQFVHLITEMT